MGVVSTVGSALANVLNTQAGAAIAGGITNTIGNGVTQAINNAISKGSNSSAIQGSTMNSQMFNSSGYQNISQSGGATESNVQQGSIAGIANALATALGTPTGNNAGGAAAFNQQSAQTANNLQNQQWMGANILNLTSNIMANMMNAASQSSAKRFNAAQSKMERDWSEAMRKTAYQDTVEDLKAAGLNPILAATNGPTGNYSGAEGSISSQGYQQAGAISAPSAHTATMQAMYDYGNNTSQFIDNMLQTINSAKQSGYTQVANWMEGAMTEGAASSAKQIEKYANTSKSTNTQQNVNVGKSESQNKELKLDGRASASLAIGGSQTEKWAKNFTRTGY